MLVQPRDVDALEEALARVLTSGDPPGRAVAQAGRRRVEQEFDVDAIAQELIRRLDGTAAARERTGYAHAGRADRDPQLPADEPRVGRAGHEAGEVLPEFGWRPTVLTGARATVGLTEDPTLLYPGGRHGEVDPLAGARAFGVLRPDTGGPGAARERRRAPRRRGGGRGVFHPKAWVIPDSQALLWYPFAVRAATRRARTWRAGTWSSGTSFPPTAILIAAHDRPRASASVRCRLP